MTRVRQIIAAGTGEKRERSKKFDLPARGRERDRGGYIYMLLDEGGKNVVHCTLDGGPGRPRRGRFRGLARPLSGTLRSRATNSQARRFVIAIYDCGPLVPASSSFHPLLAPVLPRVYPRFPNGSST